MSKVTFNKGGNKTNPKEFRIQYKLATLPYPVQPATSKIKFSWRFEGNPTDIVYVKPGCSCIAEIEIVGQEIIIYTTDTTVGHDGKKLKPADKKRGHKTLTKSLTVFLDDGVALKKKTGMTETFNFEKTHIKIEFSFKVDLTKKFPYMDPSPRKLIN